MGDKRYTVTIKGFWLFKSTEWNMKETLMPFLGSSYPLGQAETFVNAIEDADKRAIARAELAYFTGRPEDAFNLAKPYLESENVALRSSACFIAIYASLPLKWVGQAHNGMAILEHQLAHVEKTGTSDQRAMARFAFGASCALLHLSNGEEKGSSSADILLGMDALDDFRGMFSEGVQLFASYVIAHKAYLEGEYEFSLGLSAGALSMATAVYPVSFLYLYLIQCMCLISLKMPDQAREVFAKAWKIAQPDGLIQGVAEHHGLLGGLIESCVKPQDLQAYKEIIAITYSFSKGWRMIHNPITGEDVADDLSTTEFSIAMLLSKRWSIREVAVHLGISENTVKTHVKNVYKKLGINNRKDLNRFMLR